MMGAVEIKEGVDLFKKRPGTTPIEKYAKNKTISFVASKEDAKIIEDAANERGCSKSSLIRRAIFSDFHIYTDSVPGFMKRPTPRHIPIDDEEHEKYEEPVEEEKGEPLMEVLDLSDEGELGIELDAMLDLINEDESNA